MPRLIEIRTYRLKPGTIDAFDEAVRTRAVPMLRDNGIDVVAHGRSDHEEESYFLIRSFADRAELVAQQDRFYGSDAWRQGPRAALVDRIETYLNTLVWLSEEGVESLRTQNARA